MSRSPSPSRGYRRHDDPPFRDDEYYRGGYRGRGGGRGGGRGRGGYGGGYRDYDRDEGPSRGYYRDDRYDRYDTYERDDRRAGYGYDNRDGPRGRDRDDYHRDRLGDDRIERGGGGRGRDSGPPSRYSRSPIGSRISNEKRSTKSESRNGSLTPEEGQITPSSTRQSQPSRPAVPPHPSDKRRDGSPTPSSIRRSSRSPVKKETISVAGSSSGAVGVPGASGAVAGGGEAPKRLNIMVGRQRSELSYAFKQGAKPPVISQAPSRPIRGGWNNSYKRSRSPDSRGRDNSRRPSRSRSRSRSRSSYGSRSRSPSRSREIRGENDSSRRKEDGRNRGRSRSRSTSSRRSRSRSTRSSISPEKKPIPKPNPTPTLTRIPIPVPFHSTASRNPYSRLPPSGPKSERPIPTGPSGPSYNVKPTSPITSTNRLPSPHPPPPPPVIPLGKEIQSTSGDIRGNRDIKVSVKVENEENERISKGISSLNTPPSSGRVSWSERKKLSPQSTTTTTIPISTQSAINLPTSRSNISLNKIDVNVNSDSDVRIKQEIPTSRKSSNDQTYQIMGDVSGSMGDSMGGGVGAVDDVKMLTAEEEEEIRLKEEEKRIMAELPILKIPFSARGWDTEMEKYQSTLSILSSNTLKLQANQRIAQAILNDVELERAAAVERRKIVDSQLMGNTLIGIAGFAGIGI